MGIEKPKERDVIISQQVYDLFSATKLFKRETPASNHDLNAYLRRANNVPASWIGLGIVYEAPDKRFGDYVRVLSLAFKTPVKFKGMANAALIFEHPNFELDSATGLFTGKVSHVIEDFPRQSNWYKPDHYSGIPQGSSVSGEEYGVYCLLRKPEEEGVYIGAVVRGDRQLSGHQYIFVNYDPATELRVATVAQNQANLSRK